MGLIVASLYAVPAAAATYRIVVTNITAGQISGPPVVITRRRGSPVYRWRPRD